VSTTVEEVDEVDEEEEEEEEEEEAAEVAARGRRTSCDVVNIAGGRSTADDADERRGAGDVDVGAGGCGADAGAQGETARMSAVDLARAKAEASLRVADISAAGEEARGGECGGLAGEGGDGTRGGCRPSDHRIRLVKHPRVRDEADATVDPRLERSPPPLLQVEPLAGALRRGSDDARALSLFVPTDRPGRPRVVAGARGGGRRKTRGRSR
jgi:hypothetical protein